MGRPGALCEQTTALGHGLYDQGRALDVSWFRSVARRFNRDDRGGRADARHDACSTWEAAIRRLVDPLIAARAVITCVAVLDVARAALERAQARLR